MHEEQAHRVRQEQLQMLLQRCSLLVPDPICAFLQAQQALFAPTRLRVFQQRVSFLQVREFFYQPFDAFLQCLKPLSFSGTFSCFQKLSRIV